MVEQGTGPAVVERGNETEINLDAAEAAEFGFGTGTAPAGDGGTGTSAEPAAQGTVEDSPIVVDGTGAAETAQVDWKPITEQLGIAVENPTRETVEKALEEKIVAQKYPYLKEFEDNPEGKAMLEFVRNGGTRADYFGVTQKFDYALSHTDEQLLAAVAENSTDRAAVQEQYTKMTLEQRTAEAQRLRGIIEENKKAAVDKLFTESKENHGKFVEKIKAEARMNDKLVTDEIMKLEKLYDIKLDEGTKKSIAEKWNSGEYKRQFAEDPAFVAKMAATYFTAESTFRSILGKIHEAANRSSEEAKEVILRYLHNVPQKREAAATATATKKPEGQHPLSDLNLEDGPVDIEFVRQ